jgi:hypothetical protein
MPVADRGLIDLEDRILGAVAGPDVRGTGEPAVQDRLVAIMVIRPSDYEMILNPDQAARYEKPAVSRPRTNRPYSGPPGTVA